MKSEFPLTYIDQIMCCKVNIDLLSTLLALKIRTGFKVALKCINVCSFIFFTHGNPNFGL